MFTVGGQVILLSSEGAMTIDDARSIQFLRSQVGLTYRRLAEWWCHAKGVELPRGVQEFGQVLCGEAEETLCLPMGTFDLNMRDPDTFEEF
jgi:hypothetical protein